jgi:hypothetical protein
MNEAKIKVRILPLKGIGGVGNAGDVVMMSAADAEMYVRDGFVEVVVEESQTLTLPSPLKGEDVEEDDPAIVKPQARRLKRK